MAAQEKVIDIVALRVALDELEREERRLSTLRRQRHQRIDGGFANDVTIRQEREVSDQRLALHSRMDLLRATLAELDPVEAS